MFTPAYAPVQLHTGAAGGGGGAAFTAISAARAGVANKAAARKTPTTIVRAVGCLRLWKTPSYIRVVDSSCMWDLRSADSRDPEQPELNPVQIDIIFSL